MPLIFTLLLVTAGPSAGAQAPSGAQRPAEESVTAWAEDDGAGYAAGQSETFKRAVYVSIATGANWPVGDMNVAFDADVLFLARGEYAFSPLKRVGVQLGFHSFDSEQASTRDNAEIISLSVFGKALGIWGPYRPFGLLGSARISRRKTTAAVA